MPICVTRGLGLHYAGLRRFLPLNERSSARAVDGKIRAEYPDAVQLTPRPLPGGLLRPLRHAEAMRLSRLEDHRLAEGQKPGKVSRTGGQNLHGTI